MTYKQVYLTLKQLNQDFYPDWVLYEFIYDQNVVDKLSFIKCQNEECKQFKKIIQKFTKAIKLKAPYERVLKYTFFYGLKLFLNKKVFSPRVDTEILLQAFLKNEANIENQTIIDLGSGSGCICVTLSQHLSPTNKIIAYEKYTAPFKNTQLNIKKYQANIQCIKHDYLKMMAKKQLLNCDYLICNPPYINKDYKLELNVRKYDPKSALFSYGDEIKYYKKIIEYFLNTPKIKKVYFEIGFNQKELLTNFLKQYHKINYFFIKDLNENDRVLIVNRK